MNNQDWPHLAPQTQQIWETNAAFWDDFMGKDGNRYYKELVRPSAEKLLEVQTGDVVLDIACGNGNFSRRLAELGATVVATDFSPTFIERAKAHAPEYANRITYQVVDATNKEQLLTLGATRFDAAVSNMALMDMATISPLLNALTHLLKPNGRFVFTLMHPCFNSGNITKVIEQVDDEGELVTRYAIKVSNYLTPQQSKGLGVVGQPEAQHYFHRPLSHLFQHCFQAGFVIDGLEEPSFSSKPQPEKPFSWLNYQEMPPILTVRLRSINMEHRT